MYNKKKRKTIKQSWEEGYLAGKIQGTDFLKQEIDRQVKEYKDKSIHARMESVTKLICSASSFQEGITKLIMSDKNQL